MGGDRCVGTETALERWTYSEMYFLLFKFNNIKKHTVAFPE